MGFDSLGLQLIILKGFTNYPSLHRIFSKSDKQAYASLVSKSSLWNSIREEKAYFLRRYLGCSSTGPDHASSRKVLIFSGVCEWSSSQHVTDSGCEDAKTSQWENIRIDSQRCNLLHCCRSILWGKQVWPSGLTEKAKMVVCAFLDWCRNVICCKQGIKPSISDHMQ